MNKRQKKKYKKKVSDRYDYLGKYHFCWGRQNGKTYFINRMFKAIHDKRYRPFDEFKIYLEKRSR